MQLFTYYQSPLGVIKITANAHAVTAITFADGEAPCPAADKAQPLPAESLPAQPLPAESFSAESLPERCAGQLREYFEGKRAAFDFPMEQEGTAFQQRAWRELRNIPCGATICYGEQARRMGSSRAARAVGLANGRNRLSIAVPCHRVVGKNGSLTGYAGGLWRKQWLLEHEQKMANSFFEAL